MIKLNVLNTLALVLVLVGAINWGLVGLLDYDLVASLLGDMSMISRVVYSAVGVSGLYLAVVALMGSSSSQ
jgi:hypothetical protein